MTKIEKQLTAGFSLEFNDRADGYPGLQKLYGLDLTVQTMEPSLRYQAIQNGDVAVIDVYSTDSQLKAYQLTVLEDDKHLFPPYQGVPLLKKELLEKYHELETILNQLAGKISEAAMAEMNDQVDVQGISASSVAHD